MRKRKKADNVQESLPEEVLDEQIVELPPRDALSIVDPGILGAGTPVTVRPLDPMPSDPVVTDPPVS